MEQLWEKSKRTADWISEQLPSAVNTGIILGTGLGGFGNLSESLLEIPYSEIPNWPISTVASHAGKLSISSVGGKLSAVLHGRFHLYEGYSAHEVTFPIRVLHHLGVKTMIVSNACGTVNPLFHAGEVMLIDDHINLLGDNPLIGSNDDRFGPRFPDMSEPYSMRLMHLAEQSALELQLPVRRGVYAAVTGPCLETRAEYRYLRTIGADVIGMSTVPEVIVARHMRMEVLGLSVITDECFPDALKPLHLEDVIAAAGIAEPIMTQIVTRVMEKM